MNHPFLSWWEVLLTRMLMRSKKIGAIAIREYGTDMHWVLLAENDPFLSQEPDSMVLERLFHEPDAIR